MKSYSQNGEDLIVWRALGERTDGTLLSIGENDGQTLSNALLLIQQGWRGILVEPAPVPFGKLLHLHEGNLRVYPVQAAIMDYCGEIELLSCAGHLGVGDTDLLSTTIVDQTSRWNGVQFNPIKVPCITIERLWQLTVKTKIDFISIDAEGMDFDILKQIDLDELGTEVVCIEHNGVDERKYIEHMQPRGFFVLHRNNENFIFKKR